MNIHGPHPLPRLCEWCSADLNDRQLVACSPSHRLKRWRWIHGIPISPYGLVERPPDGSPLLMGYPSPGSGLRAVQTAPTGPSRVSNGGLQVSANRMFRVLREDVMLSEERARRVVGAAMSDKQRQRWEAA